MELFGLTVGGFAVVALLLRNAFRPSAEDAAWDNLNTAGRAVVVHMRAAQTRNGGWA